MIANGAVQASRPEKWGQAASDRFMAAKRCAQTPSRRGGQKSHRSLQSTTRRFGLSGAGCAGTTPRLPFSSVDPEPCGMPVVEAPVNQRQEQKDKTDTDSRG